MNKLVIKNIMKKYIKAAQVIAVIFAVVIFTFGVTQSASASLLGGIDLGNSLDLLGNTEVSQSSTVSSTITLSTCKLSTNFKTISYGGGVTLEWETTGFSNISINGQAVSGSNGTMNVTNITTNTIFELTAIEGSNTCNQTVTVTCLPPPVVECKLDIDKVVDKTTAKPGDEITYTITIKNIGTGPCSGSGVKIVDVLDPNIEYLRNTISSNLTEGYGVKPVYDTGTRALYFNGNTLDVGESGTIAWVGKVSEPTQCGDFEVNNQAKATAFELNNYLTWVTSQIVKTDIDYDCVTAVASCDTFTAAPTTVVTGNSAMLTWTTTNASRVAINNGIGNVNLDGSTSVTPLVNTTYVLSVFNATDQIVDTCEVPVTVSNNPVPVCKVFTATPNSLLFGGGTTTLAWEVEGATSVSITPTVGSVALIGSKDIFVGSNTNYVLTAIDGNGDTVTCPAPVTVLPEEPDVFTCAANVAFSISDSSITRGQDVVLDWKVTGADSVSISEINATTATGNQTVSPSNDTTYTLTATKSGFSPIDCPVSVNVSSGGGGGGGSSSPRCDLEISDTKIKLGEEITLKWDTSRATEITITDDRGKVIVTTEDLLSSDKRDLFDGEITLKPTRDTKYTLLAERGSRDDECSVKVEMDDLTVLQTRDQQPLVAGIALSNVPYTGFEAGPVLTLMFYLLLIAWALYVTYFLVLRQRTTSGGVYFTPDMGSEETGTHFGAESMKKAETIRPDVFTSAAVETAPVNLPTASVDAAVGYENYFAGNVVSEKTADEVVTQLENRAHTQKALLSSDAVEYFMKTTEGEIERNEAMDSVINEAKKHYPLEDGWIVINQARMQGLCETCVVKTEKVDVISELPAGTGSLAEAIVTGNVVAAYEMIGNRPMFSLADAAADFDAVFRNRQGGNEIVSDLLTTEVAKLSDDKIKNIIKSLTGALDGTYTDEASAVKMAIMKAVKEAA